ncbi:hypothetical protein ACSBR2_022027 [Camellia fascicularis]
MEVQVGLCSVASENFGLTCTRPQALVATSRLPSYYDANCMWVVLSPRVLNTIYLVLHIQKLAAEMGLNCVTTYKLDALKAAHRSHESSDMHTLSFVAQEPPNIDFPRNENFTNGQATQMTYTSKAELRKSIPTQRNGVGRNHGIGGRVEKSEGFSLSSFDRVLLDAPCSALGLRPRLFAGENYLDKRVIVEYLLNATNGKLLSCLFVEDLLSYHFIEGILLCGRICKLMHGGKIRRISNLDFLGACFGSICAIVSCTICTKLSM